MLDKYGGKVINIDFVKFEEQGEVVALWRNEKPSKYNLNFVYQLMQIEKLKEMAFSSHLLSTAQCTSLQNTNHFIFSFPLFLQNIASLHLRSEVICVKLL